jgi:hypothetical protein
MVPGPSWPRACPGAPPNNKNLASRPGREALGRSRGGLSTKVHLAADHAPRLSEHAQAARSLPLVDRLRSAPLGQAMLPCLVSLVFREVTKLLRVVGNDCPLWHVLYMDERNTPIWRSYLGGQCI